MTSPDDSSPKFRPSRNIWATTITSFLTDVSSEMINNLLPLFLANVLGVSTNIIGLIEGIAEMTASFLKGFSGWLSDKLGNRKWLAVLGYGLSAFAKPFLYGVTTWGGVLAVRFADRTGKGIRNSPRDALIADSVDERNRGIAFGFHRAGDTAGAVVGIGIALIVILATQAQALQLSRETFQILVLIGIIPAILAVINLAVVAKELPRKAKSDSTKPTRLSWSALNPDFKFFLLIVGIFTLGNSSDAFIILRAQERGLSVADILGMLLTFNLIYAVFSSPLGSLSDRIGRKRILIGGWLVYGVLYFCFGLANDGGQIWLIYALYGLYYAAAEGTAKALIADIIPSEQRGTAYGYYNALVGFMAFPASLLAGVLWQGIGAWGGFGASAPFFFGSFLALIAVGMLIFFWRRPHISSE